MPPELSTSKTSPTNEKVQRKLLHCYERKFVNLPDHLQLIQLCCNVGITKTVKKGQYVTTLDDAELEKLGVHFTSRQLIIQSERMDLWEHEDRSSFRGGSQSPSRQLRNRDHETIFI